MENNEVLNQIARKYKKTSIGNTPLADSNRYCTPAKINQERKRVEEITRKYTPYVYGYTVILPQDDFSIDKLPEKVQVLLTNYKDCKVRLLCDQNRFVLLLFCFVVIGASWNL
ncbi:hypothetical protein [Lacrimispora sp.]|uniref:hypothetical protein n=1 Tax=Lacrimispora sp. TaxID=2719234 RepID=UPI002FDB4E61